MGESRQCLVGMGRVTAEFLDYIVVPNHGHVCILNSHALPILSP